MEQFLRTYYKNLNPNATEEEILAFLESQGFGLGNQTVTGGITNSPNIFQDSVAYIACEHDYSDLEEKIDHVLTNYDEHLYIIENARKKFSELYRPENIVLHVYNLIKNLEGVTNE